jgi:hypothetical protein
MTTMAAALLLLPPACGSTASSGPGLETSTGSDADAAAPDDLVDSGADIVPGEIPGPEDAEPEVDQWVTQCTADEDCAAALGDPPACKAFACQEGRCVFAPVQDQPCDDGNLCTTGDACKAGKCFGTAVECVEPPAGVCIDAWTLEGFEPTGTCNAGTGECEYTPATVTCEVWCVSGTCVASLGMLHAELTPAGLVGMKSASWKLECVMPGWASGPEMSSAGLTLTPGIEP